MPFVKGGRFEDVHSNAPVKRQVSYAWHGENPPFLNDFHLFEDHEGIFRIAYTLRHDDANNRNSQCYQLSVDREVKTKNSIALDINKDDPKLTVMALSTKSYELFKDIFAILRRNLPGSSNHARNTERRERDRDLMQVDTPDRNRDRSPAKRYLILQSDSFHNIQDVIDNIASELAKMDIVQTTQKLGAMKLHC